MIIVRLQNKIDRGTFSLPGLFYCLAPGDTDAPTTTFKNFKIGILSPLDFTRVYLGILEY